MAPLTPEGLATVVEVVNQVLSQPGHGTRKVSAVGEGPNIGVCWLRQSKRPISAQASTLVI